MILIPNRLLAAEVAAVVFVLAVLGHAQAPPGEFATLKLKVVERLPAQPSSPGMPNLAKRLDLNKRPEGAELDADLHASAEGRGKDEETSAPRVTMASGRVVQVPLPLLVMLSDDGRTLLQYGDALMRMHPLRTDLFWIGEDGKVLVSVQNRYEGDALLDMSSDGFTAVAAPPFFPAREAVNAGKPEPAHIVELYSPEGKRILSEKLAQGLIVHHLHALSAGEGVVLVVAPKETPLEQNELQFLREKEPLRRVATEFGTLQKIVLLGKGDFVFIQGSNAHGIVELVTGKTRWRQVGKIRLVSPEGAAVGPDGKRLYLMTGDRASPDALYHWTLSILDLENGKLLGQAKIDGSYRGTAEKVFESIKSDRVIFRAGDERIVVDVQ